MIRLKKIGKFFLRVFVISLITLCLLEVSYRYQWVDFYATEWESLNKFKRSTSDKRILVFGDSFTADRHSWITQLRDLDSSVSYFNAAMPGVGVETFRFIAKSRISEVNPDLVIIQLYVGNDLYDIAPPINWSENSIARNLFWSISKRFRVLNYLNYKAGQFSIESNSLSGKITDNFAIEKYASRTKLYIKADKKYPASTIHLDGNNKQLYDKIIEGIYEIKNHLSPNSKLKILVVPHCTQVHSSYRKNFKKLAAFLDNLDQNKSPWVDVLKQKGFDVIDPLFELQKQENEGKSMYFQNDPHLNEEGQKVLAKYVLKDIL